MQNACMTSLLEHRLECINEQDQRESTEETALNSISTGDAEALQQAQDNDHTADVEGSIDDNDLKSKESRSGRYPMG